MKGRARLEPFGLEERGVPESGAGETAKIDLSERPERSEEVVLGCALSEASDLNEVKRHERSELY